MKITKRYRIIEVGSMTDGYEPSSDVPAIRFDDGTASGWAIAVTREEAVSMGPHLYQIVTITIEGEESAT